MRGLVQSVYESQGEMGSWVVLFLRVYLLVLLLHLILLVAFCFLLGRLMLAAKVWLHTSCLFAVRLLYSFYFISYLLGRVFLRL